MLTEQQIEAAKKALAQKRTKDLLKKIALHRRQRCIDDIQFYYLPYRVLYDHRGADPDERPLNKYYPLPGLPKETADQAGVMSIRTEEDAIYYCSRFLRYENFDLYAPFDFTGQVLQGAELEAIRTAYKARQDDYRRNPGKYWSHIDHPNSKAPDDTKRYYCFYD